MDHQVQRAQDFNQVKTSFWHGRSNLKNTSRQSAPQPENYHKKGKGTYSSLRIDPWQSYGASPAILDHTVIPATRHRWARPALTPAMQAGTRFTYPGGMEGWVGLVTRKRRRRESNSRPLGPESNALTTEPPSNNYINRALANSQTSTVFTTTSTSLWVMTEKFDY